MADIKHAGPELTEGDGIEYKGLAVSMVVLAIITLICYGIVVGFFKFMEGRAADADAPRAPLAAPATQPSIQDGRVVGGPAAVPNLLVREPVNLQKFRDEEEHLLSTYGWVDQNNGLVRLPIDRAKELVLQRGFTVRPGAPAGEAKAPGGEAKPAEVHKSGEHK
jgi:hypothetical protein